MITCTVCHLNYSLTMLCTSRIETSFFFSPNISTTLWRSSSVAIVQHSTPTDTYTCMNNKIKEAWSDVPLSLSLPLFSLPLYPSPTPLSLPLPLLSLPPPSLQPSSVLHLSSFPSPSFKPSTTR